MTFSRFRAAYEAARKLVMEVSDTQRVTGYRTVLTMRAPRVFSHPSDTGALPRRRVYRQIFQDLFASPGSSHPVRSSHPRCCRSRTHTTGVIVAKGNAVLVIVEAKTPIASCSQMLREKQVLRHGTHQQSADHPRDGALKGPG